MQSSGTVRDFKLGIWKKFHWFLFVCIERKGTFLPWKIFTVNKNIHCLIVTLQVWQKKSTQSLLDCNRLWTRVMQRFDKKVNWRYCSKVPFMVVTLVAEMFGVGDFWLETRVIIMIFWVDHFGTFFKWCVDCWGHLKRG